MFLFFCVLSLCIIAAVRIRCCAGCSGVRGAGCGVFFWGGGARHLLYGQQLATVNLVFFLFAVVVVVGSRPWLLLCFFYCCCCWCSCCRRFPFLSSSSSSSKVLRFFLFFFLKVSLAFLFIWVLYLNPTGQHQWADRPSVARRLVMVDNFVVSRLCSSLVALRWYENRVWRKISYPLWTVCKAQKLLRSKRSAVPVPSKRGAGNISPTDSSPKRAVWCWNRKLLGAE